MFLFDPTYAADFAKAESEIRRILDRAEAEVVFLRKFDERKLAYEIRGRKRGTYVLTYFRCDSSRVAAIDRDARLSEEVLRHLILSADDITPERMGQFAAEARAHAAGDEGRVGNDRPHREPERHAESRDLPSAIEEPVGAGYDE
jgi:small subunit ribosomal protein S6